MNIANLMHLYRRHTTASDLQASYTQTPQSSDEQMSRSDYKQTQNGIDAMTLGSPPTGIDAMTLGSPPTIKSSRVSQPLT